MVIDSVGLRREMGEYIVYNIRGAKHPLSVTQ